MTRMVLIICSAALLISCGRGQGGAEKSASASNKDAAQQPASPAEGKIKISESGQAKVGIEVATIEPQSVPQYLTAAGQIAPNEERTAHVGAYTDGRVLELRVNVGDFVRRGTVLARMHSHDVHETRAAYETALQDVMQREAALHYQEEFRARTQRLYDLKSASAQEVRKADEDLRSARTDLERAHISVQKEVAHLTDILHLQPSQLKSIDENTENIPLISPINGTVVSRTVTVGSVLEPGNEAFVISDFGSVWVIAAVNEKDIRKVKLGQKARVLTEAYPDERFNGVITRLGTELDPKTRTLPVRISVPNPGAKLKIDMFATAQIAEGPSRQSLFVPEQAIQNVNGSSVVFIRTASDTFQPKAVELADRINGRAEVRSGLKSGDAVVVAGSFAVKSQMLKSQIGE